MRTIIGIKIIHLTIKFKTGMGYTVSNTPNKCTTV